MSDSEKSFKLAPTVEDKDVLKLAVDTRNYEISMFWQRSNYFLVLNTALGVAFFKTSGVMSLGVALFGFLAAFIWYRVCLGGKFWQVRWEQRLAKAEKAIAPELGFFAADWSLIQADVHASLVGSNHNGFFRKWLDRQILKKPSVSYNMTILSMLFMAAWATLAGIKFLLPH